ncbi:MAG: hypothetical protein ACO2PN_19930 [Pyrobaculum sp.]|jgi:hypothetical protein
MELYQIIIVAIALVNLAVAVWLLRLIIPVWQTLRKVVFVVDQYDFDKLAKQFLNGEKPLAENVVIKTIDKKEEGYREISIIRTYKRPLDPREVQENFVRQMAEKLQ